jgi:hypothetical protein
MKINKVIYNSPEADKLIRWLEHIIERTLLEYLECNDLTNVELITSKYRDLE